MKPASSFAEKLALEGGVPVRSTLLPYGHQVIEDADIAAVTEALRSDFLTTGPEVERFEQAVAQISGARYAIAVSNGTAALHAAVAALDLSPEDEVIVPALTFAASANCVRYCGARVVFADVRPDSLTLDPAAVRAAVTPRAKAVIAVDFAGQPADYAELRELASRHHLALIADAAHSLGARYRDRPSGSLALMTTFSFHPVKHITTGEGGMIVTSDERLAARLRRFRNHGIATDFRQREAGGDWFYRMEMLGFNYRLSDLQCALGRAQLQRLPRWLDRRRALVAAYGEALAAQPALELPITLPGRDSAWHLYVARLRLPNLRWERKQIFQALRAENIGVNVHYIPVPWHPYYQQLGYRRGDWPVAEAEYERLLSLPLWAGMDRADIGDVAHALRKVLAAAGAN